MKLVIDKKGKLKFLYNEKLDISSLGKMKIRRLSEVNYNNKIGKWQIKYLSNNKMESKLFNTKREAVSYEISKFNKVLGKL